MKTDLIVALDLPNPREIAPALARLPHTIDWFKIGLELFCAGGPDTLAPLREAGRSIFLDLKLHDIPRTVERAVKSAARHGARLLTVHAGGGRAMLRAAADAAAACGSERPRLLAVTLLTSLDEGDLRELGIGGGLSDQVLRLADLAMACGIDGLVCSPLEAARLRQRLGPAPLLVTPGIRMAEDESGDQKRVGTPSQAARDGATHIVVGRPILEASDPAAATARILADLRRAGG